MGSVLEPITGVAACCLSFSRVIRLYWAEDKILWRQLGSSQTKWITHTTLMDPNEFCSPSLHIHEPWNHPIHPCPSQSQVSGWKPPRVSTLEPTLALNPCIPSVLVDSSLTDLPFQFSLRFHPLYLTSEFRSQIHCSEPLTHRSRLIYSSPNVLILRPVRGL